MNTFYWLLKREYWEHRGSFLWAPIIASATFLAFNLMALITAVVFANRWGWEISTQPYDSIARALQDHGSDLGAVVDISLLSATGIATITMIFVVFFYCLGALLDDRRDRSVLLWKSMPVSDTATVLSKYVSAAVVVPVIATLIGMACALLMLLLTATTFALHGMPASVILDAAHPFKVFFSLLALLPVNLVWALPTLGWLLLVSAWARSKAFLWAVGIPVGVGILMSWFDVLGSLNLGIDWFWSHVVSRLLLGMVPYGWMDFGSIFERMESGVGVLNPFDVQSAWVQLVQPDFWIGAIAGIIMIVAAIQLRKLRTEA